MAKDKEKELARILFVDSNLSQKEIAEKVNVSEVTLSAWAKAENWDKLKQAHETSNIEAIVNLREVIRLLTQKIKQLTQDGQLESKHTDQLNKVASTLDALEKGIPLRVVVQVLESFIDWLPNTEHKFKTKLADFHIQYILQLNK